MQHTSGGKWAMEELLNTSLMPTGSCAVENGTIYMTTAHANYGGPVKPADNARGALLMMVVEADIAERKINLGDTPYFNGATTPKPNTLGTANKVEKFEFTPDESGEFSFACGFPTHSANGNRIFLKIKKDLKKAASIMPEKINPKQNRCLFVNSC